MQRCSDCGHKMYKETKYMSWLSLMNFVNFLETECYIETQTAEEMRDHLMDFKIYALEESFDKEESSSGEDLTF